MWPAEHPSERMKRRASETTRHEAIQHDKAPNPNPNPDIARGLRARGAYLTRRRSVALCPQLLHKRHVATLRGGLANPRRQSRHFSALSAPRPPEPRLSRPRHLSADEIETMR
ncbi:hypothetical protein IQ07DRAFT_390192 [Pyrenochaeta sp. DS3sAY3a]|nr:hypothetical protein IQ07DRAFT_390192 [Pyrenochaeta sp. DS3sAY3a]